MRIALTSRSLSSALLVALPFTLFTLLVTSDAAAQPLQPLPPPEPPPPGSQPPPPPPTYTPPPYQPPPPNYNPNPPTYYPPPQRRPAPPGRYEYIEPPEEPVHAPKFSLWTGARLSFMGFGNSFYTNQNGNAETTGNFLGNGLGLELDVGARLGKRYLPYVFYEHGFMGQGHRFTGSDASSSTNFYGVGFRYTAGDVDSVGFLSDLSIGYRTVHISQGSDTYTMSALEIFRLGLGAEIRISTMFVISPLAWISGGVMNDTSGNINFSADGSHDNIKGPTYVNGATIDQQRGYLVLGIGCGGHFDLLGK